jgi:hypothetical protein
MTTTAMCTTTEMMSALLERVMDDLYARGIRALYSHFELCDFLFSRRRPRAWWPWPCASTQSSAR